MTLTGTALGRVVALFGFVALAGCTQSTPRLSPDFGAALGQDIKAQIADPDAHYAGLPEAGTNGRRAALAQERYETNQVIQPTNLPGIPANASSGNTNANSSGSTSGAGNGSTNGDANSSDSGMAAGSGGP